MRQFWSVPRPCSVRCPVEPGSPSPCLRPPTCNRECAAIRGASSSPRPLASTASERRETTESPRTDQRRSRLRPQMRPSREGGDAGAPQFPATDPWPAVRSCSCGTQPRTRGDGRLLPEQRTASSAPQGVAADAGTATVIDADVDRGGRGGHRRRLPEPCTSDSPLDIRRWTWAIRAISGQGGSLRNWNRTRTLLSTGTSNVVLEASHWLGTRNMASLPSMSSRRFQ